MREIEGNLWGFHDQGNWIVITTNGTIRKDGACVMGRGVALEAKERYPELPYLLGNYIKKYGNKLMPCLSRGIVCFPTKYNWQGRSGLGLIENSCKELVVWSNTGKKDLLVYMPRPGCGNGQLNWEDVRPILEKHLDDRFIVVERGLT